jgi:hypothetical protein
MGANKSEFDKVGQTVACVVVAGLFFVLFYAAFGDNVAYLNALLALIPATIAKKRGFDFMPWYVGGQALWILALILSILRDPPKDPEVEGYEAVRRALENDHA